jgi:hypothetical protein
VPERVKKWLFDRFSFPLRTKSSKYFSRVPSTVVYSPSRNGLPLAVGRIEQNGWPTLDHLVFERREAVEDEQENEDDCYSEIPAELLELSRARSLAIQLRKPTATRVGATRVPRTVNDSVETATKNQDPLIVAPTIVTVAQKIFRL